MWKYIKTSPYLKCFKAYLYLKSYLSQIISSKRIEWIKAKYFTFQGIPINLEISEINMSNKFTLKFH